MNELELEFALDRLVAAVSAGRSENYCLRLWSKFVRLRDGGRCVLCYRTDKLAAHHILRKCYMPLARFAPGNGITLCPTCHAEPHEIFNGRPDATMPMDAEGGERIDFMMGLFDELLEDAKRHNLMVNEYYRLGEEVISEFRRLQGLPESVDFPGMDVERAYWIWRQTSRFVMFALTKANGFSIPPDIVQRAGAVEADGLIFVTEPPARNK